MTQPTDPVTWLQGTFWMLDLGQPRPPDPTPRIPVAFMQAGPEVAEELAQAMDLDDQAVVMQRFNNGRCCYVGRSDGRIVTYGWVTFDEEAIGELGLSIRLKAAEAYIWNCATSPAYRGQRLYPALLAYIVGELHRRGVRRIWIGTDGDNLPSQRGLALTGMQPVSDAFISRIWNMQRVWLRERPGVPEQVVMDIRAALFGEREEVWLATHRGEPSVGTMHPHVGIPLVLAGEPPGSARAAMILLHGRGATAHDILTLTPELHSQGFLYLAPHAAGNAWYPNSYLAPLISNEPALSSALVVVASLLDQLSHIGIPAERTILLGFSQGACLALEYAARTARRYGGVVGLSGGLIGPEGAPRAAAGELAGTPVFLGCSDVDPYISRERVEQAAETLRLLGGDMTTRFYPGLDHTVNQDELQFVQDMMNRVLPDGNW